MQNRVFSIISGILRRKAIKTLQKTVKTVDVIKKGIDSDLDVIQQPIRDFAAARMEKHNKTRKNLNPNSVVGNSIFGFGVNFEKTFLDTLGKNPLNAVGDGITATVDNVNTAIKFGSKNSNGSVVRQVELTVSQFLGGEDARRAITGRGFNGERLTEAQKFESATKAFSKLGENLLAAAGLAKLFKPSVNLPDATPRTTNVFPKSSGIGSSRVQLSPVKVRGNVANPATIRFTQPTASPNFSTGGHTITSTAKQLAAGKSPASLPTIRVVEHNGQLFTLDNRRLAAFQAAKVKEIPIQRVSLTDPAIRAEFLKKFNPIDGGSKIVIVPKSGRAAAEAVLRKNGKIK